MRLSENRRRGRVLAAAGVVVALLAASCDVSGPTPAPSSTPPPPPRPYTVMSTDAIRVTDPAAITDAASSMVSLNVFQRLMTAPPGEQVLKPDAAKDCLFTSSTTYTCTLNKDLVGRDAHILAEVAGARVPPETQLLIGETTADHPFVREEQMMPFVPLVRVRGVDEAIERAVESEHGYRHTAVIHSRNVETITRMGRELDTTLFVQNGPSTAGLGSGGEGYLSFSIATPTGEGVTTPLTFTRQRRSTTVKAMRVI